MNERSHLPMERLEVYKLAVSVGDEIWATMATWPYFEKATVGKQLVRAIDSVGANLVEAGGRPGEADAIRFLTIARASALESGFWLERAAARDFIDESSAVKLMERLNHTVHSVNGLINFRREQMAGRHVREAASPYSSVERVEPNAVHLAKGSVREAIPVCPSAERRAPDALSRTQFKTHGVGNKE